MVRPGKNIEQVLLASGQALYAELGCTRLSVRAVTQHAQVPLGMFHYHFKSKDEFLAQVLQQLYERMFSQLSERAGTDGPPLARLRLAIGFLAGFVRDHNAVLGRILADAFAGQPVVAGFVRANAPRHVGLLLTLMAQAEQAGQLAPAAPLQRMVFVMGAVAFPLLVAPRIAALGVLPAPLGAMVDGQLLSDAAIAQRIDWVLAALGPEPRNEQQTSKPR